MSRAELIKKFSDYVYYFNAYCTSDAEDHEMLKAVLDLLKEQEAVEPKQVDLYGKEDWYGLVCVCPHCKAEWMSDEADTHFCPKCGQAVKWE